MCNAMQVLTAMGTTFVVSSGDAGPYSYGQVSGFPSPGGTQRLVSYPSGCPYVLSVGATGDYGVNERPVHYEMPFYFNTNRTDGQQGWASGCGTSSLWPIPDFQKGLVEPYFANSANYNGSKISAFSTSTPGRTFPDLSVQVSIIALVLGLIDLLTDACFFMSRVRISRQSSTADST